MVIEMHTSCALLSIAVLLLTSNTPSTTAQNAPNKGITCPKPIDFPNCLCNATSFHYPKSNPTLRVVLSSNDKELDVICHDNDFGDLPNLHIANINKLVVTNCNPVADKPLLETIRFVGVNSTKQLVYTNQDSKIPSTAESFEGLQDLELLVLDGGIERIELGAFNNLRNLRTLNITANDELKLQLGVFDHLADLIKLNLANNKIRELESGILQNQRKLQKLDLSQNKLRELKRSTFQELQNLEFLDLSINEIETLSSDTFGILKNLTKLHLSFNRLNIFSGNLTKNRELKTIILTDNRAPLILSEHFLSHLPELQAVHLQNNALHRLPENIFRESNAIVKLDLSRNFLETLPESLLHDQWNLESLRLDHNRIAEIPDEFFKKTTKLTNLQLTGNKLHSLGGNIFKTLAKLQVLHLENNNLQFIDDKTFKGTTSLQQLYMQNNRLSFEAMSYAHKLVVDDDIKKLTPLQYLQNLHVLNLRNNSITTIFKDWQTNTVKLKQLDLSYNAISNLFGVYNLKFFSSKINVDLSHNRISHISELDLGQDMSHVTVRLTGNPLNFNCFMLEFVQYVKANNNLHMKFISDDLRCSGPHEPPENSLTALRTLDLTCPLTGDNTGCPSDCRCIIRPADRTIIVNCTGQALSEIRSLPKPSEDYNFTELDIRNNFFRELPTLKLPGYEKVVAIYAQDNYIEWVSEKNLPSQLHLIDLTFNRLNTLSKPVLEALTNSSYLTNVQLSYNPWTCDCSNEDFVYFVQKNHEKLSDKSHMICEDSRRIDSLNVNELCNKNVELIENVELDGNALNVLFLILGCSGLLLGILSAFYYSYQIEIKVWLFTHNLFQWFVTEEELDKNKLYDAFISYSHKDALFVERELVPRMENLMNFKTCVHERDWIPGEAIPEQIISSVENSRRTVIVLSKHYLESTWAQLEFRTAHLQSLAEKRVRVIIIVFGDIGDIESLDSELKAYLKMNTYVKHEDPWFWDKLRYAMPHPVSAMTLKKQRRKRSRDARCEDMSSL